MNIVIWTFEEIRVVMVETDQGELYTTSPVLARALDVSPHSLSKTYNTKKEEFDGLRGTTFPSKNFLHNNRKQLGLSRVRSDVHLWSEGDMIVHALTARTQQGRRFRKGLVDFIKRNAVKEYATRAQLETMQMELNELRELLGSH